MPFYRVQVEDRAKNKDPQTYDADIHEQLNNDVVSDPRSAYEVPIFLIPGILGNATELQNLIQELQDSTRPLMELKILLQKLHSPTRSTTELQNLVQKLQNSDYSNTELQSLVSKLQNLAEKKLSSDRPSTELLNLIQKLQSSARPIYVYYDSRFINNDATNTKGKQSLNEQAKSIANNMLSWLKKGPSPYVIAGYSFGCPLAVLAAQELQEQGQDTHLYLIDGVSPEATKEYFTHLTPAAISDLTKMMNYAARLSNLDEITINDDQNVRLQHMPVDNIIQYLYDNISQNNTEVTYDNQKKFLTLTSIIRQNIQNLLGYANAPLNNIHQITALITSGTAEKYADDACGWDKYTDKLFLVKNTHLLKQEHTDLMLDDNAKDLANSIKLFIKNEVTSEKFFEKCISYYLTQFQKNKDEDLDSKDDEDLNDTCSPEVSNPPSPDIHLLSINKKTENGSISLSENTSPVALSPSSDTSRMNNIEDEKTPPESGLFLRKTAQDRSIKDQFKLFSRSKTNEESRSAQVINQNPETARFTYLK